MYQNFVKLQIIMQRIFSTKNIVTRVTERLNKT